MGLTGSLTNYAVSKTAEKIALENLKRGKSDEQKDCIDFLYNDGGCGCGKKMFLKYTMESYEQLVANKLLNLNLRQRAINKIGLDEDEISEIPPIVLSGYVYEANSSSDTVLVHAEQGRAVSSRFNVSWIFFSKTQLYAYSYTFDTISDNTYEKTQDFFYQDITCFTTLQRVVENIEFKMKGCGCLRFGSTPVKNNYIVDSLNIQVPGTSFSFSMRNNDTLEQSIQAAKAMLRERKFVH